MILVSVLLITLGFFIRMVGIRYLGSSMTWRVQTPPVLVTGGIYSIIRHPLYLGGMIVLAGLSLLFTRSPGITIVLVYMSLHWYLDRIDREEQILVRNFGELYLDYMRSTKTLIPFIW